MNYPRSISKSVRLLGRHGELVLVDDLLPKLEAALAHWDDESLVWAIDDVKVILTFRHNVFVHAANEGTLKCAHCQLQATHFAIEKVAASKAWPESWALNLYGSPHEKRTYFTQDHIVPKSKGGPTDLDNLQVMCWPCNLRKGDS